MVHFCYLSFPFAAFNTVPSVHQKKQCYWRFTWSDWSSVAHTREGVAVPEPGAAGVPVPCRPSCSHFAFQWPLAQCSSVAHSLWHLIKSALPQWQGLANVPTLCQAVVRDDFFIYGCTPLDALRSLVQAFQQTYFLWLFYTFQYSQAVTTIWAFTTSTLLQYNFPFTLPAFFSSSLNLHFNFNFLSLTPSLPLPHSLFLILFPLPMPFLYYFLCISLDFASVLLFHLYFTNFKPLIAKFWFLVYPK